MKLSSTYGVSKVIFSFNEVLKSFNLGSCLIFEEIMFYTGQIHSAEVRLVA